MKGRDHTRTVRGIRKINCGWCDSLWVRWAWVLLAFGLGGPSENQKYKFEVFALSFSFFLGGGGHTTVLILCNSLDLSLQSHTTRHKNDFTSTPNSS